MFPRETHWCSHCTLCSTLHLPPLLFQSLALTPCRPSPSPHHNPPLFSNRRLEINSTLVWPETLVELNMNDWDCSYLLLRETWWLLGIWVWVFCSFLQQTVSPFCAVLTAYWITGLPRSVGDQCQALWRYCLGCHFFLSAELWPVRLHDLIEQMGSWTSQSRDSSAGKTNQRATPILQTQQQQHLNMKELSGY